MNYFKGSRKSFRLANKKCRQEAKRQDKRAFRRKFRDAKNKENFENQPVEVGWVG